MPTARHRCDISSKEAVLPVGVMTRKWAPQTRYTHRCDTASIMKDLIVLFQLNLLRLTSTYLALIKYASNGAIIDEVKVRSV